MTVTEQTRLESLPPLAVATRIERLRNGLEAAGVDALVVTTMANVRYLTGFSGSAGVVTVTEDAVLLTTDGRYRTQSAEQVRAAGVEELVRIEIGNAQAQREAARRVLAAARAGRIGLEAENVSWAASERWREAFEGVGEIVATSGIVEELRQRKDAGEVARMERAAAIADAALADVLPLLASAPTEAVTEAEVALALDTAMRRHGAEDRAFDTIIASGPNSAKPHHQPTQRQVRAGDAVVVDFGAVFDGYRSDMTRTFCIGGEPEGMLAKLFDVVASSQARGVAAVRPGMGAKDVDDVCRRVIEEAGLAERFEHGTGHGVGLDIHEAPAVSQQGTGILEPGVVFTVEPGVYVPGVGGVRIEDTLIVTEDASRPFTHFPKDIVV